MRFNLHSHKLKHFLLPGILFAVVALVAMFMPHNRNWLLPVLFLLLPFFDFQWRIPRVLFNRQSLISWLVLGLITIILLLKNTALVDLFVVMVIVAALPEEWFFRAYLQKRLGNNMAAVVFVSLMFSLMHFITQSSVIAWLVFIPSVFFGWVYKKTGDLILVIIMHAFSNLLYYVYLKLYIADLLSR